MKITGERTVYSGDFIEQKEIDIIKPNGEPGIWEMVSRKGPGAVSALVENTDNNSFILVEQFRPAVKSRVLELVAGIIDKPYNKEQIIREEIREEIGYNADSIEFVMSGPNSAGLTDEISYDYYARVSGKRLEQNLGDCENIEIIEVDKFDINKLIESKEKQGILISHGISSVLYKLLILGKIRL